MHFPLIAAAIFLAAAVPSAPAAQLTIVTSGPAPRSEPPLKVDIRAAGAAAGREALITMGDEITIGGLEPGLYEVRLTDPNRWAAPATVYVKDRAAAQLVVHARSMISGRFASAERRIDSPSHLIARFRGADIEGEVPCSIEGLRWFCAVPAARLDLAIKPAGHVSRFWWDVDATAAPVDVGKLQLRRGASLVGRVVLPKRSDSSLLSTVTVRLRPESGAVASDRRIETLALTAKPNAKGLFVFESVPPGRWLLDAVSPGLTVPLQRVRILDGVESELREPLRLDAPHRFEVQVEPALDPWGRPWVIAMDMETEVAHVTRPERQSSAGPDGRWRADALAAGTYVVEVKSSNGNRWLTRTVALPVEEGMTLGVATSSLRGVVTLGNKPLRSRLLLKSDDGASVRATTSDKGRFAVYFPETAGIDEVLVEASDPPVSATVTEVHLRGPAGDRRLEIALPETALAGEVVDADGRPVVPAFVYASHEDGGTLPEIHVGSDGTFSIHALPEGRIRLRARAAGNRSSDPVETEIKEEQGSFVTLVVRPERTRRGRVVSASGPVPGAVVHAFPRPGGAFASPQHVTDANGEFVLQLNAAATLADFYVAAPGFATRIFRQTLSEEEIEIHVRQSGGALRISAEESKTPMTIQYGGAVFPLGPLLATSLRGDDGSERFVISEIEPGAYTICRAAHCVQAVVVPLATVDVSLQ